MCSVPDIASVRLSVSLSLTVYIFFYKCAECQSRISCEILCILRAVTLIITVTLSSVVRSLSLLPYIFERTTIFKRAGAKMFKSSNQTYKPLEHCGKDYKLRSVLPSACPVFINADVAALFHDFFPFNNQPDTLIIQIYSVIKLYRFRGSLPIIRSSLLYMLHWYVSCRF
jgi:hypothetical protein